MLSQSFFGVLEVTLGAAVSRKLAAIFAATDSYPSEIQLGEVDGYHLNFISPFSPFETTNGQFYFLDADNNGYPFSAYVSGTLISDSVHYDWLDAFINDGQDVTEKNNTFQIGNLALSLPTKHSLVAMNPQATHEKSSEYPQGQYWSSTLYQPDYHFRVALIGGGSVDIASDKLSSTATGSVIFEVTTGPAVETITAAIETVTAQRAEYGAMQNRLQYTISNLMSVNENTVTARSRVEDADFARESAVLAKTQVLQQSGAAMLAQANAWPQLILQLIK